MKTNEKAGLKVKMKNINTTKQFFDQNFNIPSSLRNQYNNILIHVFHPVIIKVQNLNTPTIILPKKQTKKLNT